MWRFASGSWSGCSHLCSFFTMLRTSIHPTIAHPGTLGRLTLWTRKLSWANKLASPRLPPGRINYFGDTNYPASLTSQLPRLRKPTLLVGKGDWVGGTHPRPAPGVKPAPLPTGIGGAGKAEPV